jgi:hypothetical protein
MFCACLVTILVGLMCFFNVSIDTAQGIDKLRLPVESKISCELFSFIDGKKDFQKLITFWFTIGTEIMLLQTFPLLKIL